MSSADFGGRIERLISELRGDRLDCLLVTDLSDVRYLTGYTGSNGAAVLGAGLRLFVTDFRYLEQAADQVDPSFDRVHARRELFVAVSERLAESPSMRMGFDDAHLSVRQHGRLRELLPPQVELVPAAGKVERLRRCKDAGEVTRIGDAARLADEAFEEVVDAGLVGRTERSVALALEVAMRERGAEAVSFMPIVAAGPHGALPHAEPRQVPIRGGELVVIDWGARLDGYCSDCTRTVATGPLAGEAREIYELVRAALSAGLEALKSGAAGADVDRCARELIGAAGYGEFFGHGLGHGVGLDIHEAPGLGTRSRDVLTDGDVVTVEPGIYLPGRFGVRVEDLAVVREDGCEVLSGLNTELRVVS